MLLLIVFGNFVRVGDSLPLGTAFASAKSRFSRGEAIAQANATLPPTSVVRRTYPNRSDLLDG